MLDLLFDKSIPTKVFIPVLNKNIIVPCCVAVLLIGCASSPWSISEQYYKPEMNSPLVPIHVLDFRIDNVKDNHLSKANAILEQQKSLCPGGYNIHTDSLTYYEGLKRVSFLFDCYEKNEPESANK